MAQRKFKEKKSYAKKKGIDYTLLFVILFLLCFGLVMLYSTSSYSAMIKQGDGAFYLKKQIFATGIGLLFMAAATVIDYRAYAKLAVPLYLISLGTICLVMTGLGIEANGARRWIDLGVISFQPAEFAKVTLIMIVALFISNHKKDFYTKKGHKDLLAIVKTLGFGIVVAAMLFVITDNLSSAIIAFGISFVMVFIVTPRWKLLLGVIGTVGVAGVAFLAMGSGFRGERFAAWLNPEAYADTTAYQTMQARYAIGSGGLTGKGLGQSVQKMGYVPEAQNDMIFSIICEELGLLGGIAIMALFGFMIYRLAIIATNARDLYGSMIAVGVLSHIAIQVILNIAVVTGAIPNTGVTLPFISYGGTSILFLLTEMGLALSVSKYERGNK